MNWIEIQQKYYNAWFLLGSKKYGHLWRAFDGDTRVLYDFFDEQGIIIEIQPSYDTNVNFAWKIYQNYFPIPKLLDTWTSLLRTRSEAETEAFTSAFRILNDKLKSNE